MELDDRVFARICKMLAHYCNGSSINPSCPISALDKDILTMCPFIHKASPMKGACEYVDQEDWKKFLKSLNESYLAK